MSVRNEEGRVSGESNTRVGLLLLLATLFMRVPFMFEGQIDWDEATYTLLGHELIEGRLPFVELWDNKPPVLYMAYGLFEAIFGRTILAPRLLGIVCVWLGAWIVARTGRRLGGRAAGLAAGLLTVVFSSYHPGEFATMSEHVVLPFLAGAVHRLVTGDQRRGNLLLVGVLMGIACLVRNSLAVTGASVALVLVVLQRRVSLSSQAWLLLGALLPVGLLAAVYGAAGELDALITGLVRSPLAYVTEISGSPLAVIGEALAETFRTKSFLLGLSFLGGVVLFVRQWRRGALDRRQLAVVLIWVATLLSFASTGRVMDHYVMQVVPTMAIMGGLFLTTLRGTRTRRIVLAVLLVGGLAGAVRAPVRNALLVNARIAEAGTPFHDEVHQLVEWLKARDVEGRPVYFMQYHIAAWLSGARQPTPYAHPTALNRPDWLSVWEGEGSTAVGEMQKIFDQQPLFVVRQEDRSYLAMWPQAVALLEATLAADYRLATRFDEILVYERR